MGEKKDIISKLKELRKKLNQIKEEERKFQFQENNEKFNFEGTDNIEDMIGKVGFIDTEGKYYPVRNILYHRVEEKDNITTHDTWASKYLREVKKLTGRYSSPSTIIMRKYYFVMIIEAEFTPHIKLNGISYLNKLTVKQQEALNKLNEYYKNQSKRK